MRRLVLANRMMSASVSPVADQDAAERPPASEELGILGSMATPPRAQQLPPLRPGVDPRDLVVALDMTLRGLKERARELGVAEELIEGLDDARDAKAAAVDLVMRATKDADAVGELSRRHLDEARRRLRLRSKAVSGGVQEQQQCSRVSVTFEDGLMGLKWTYPTSTGRLGPFTVAFVAEGMTAARAGVVEGMRLVELDGVSMEEWHSQRGFENAAMLEKMAKSRPLTLVLQAMPQVSPEDRLGNADLPLGGKILKGFDTNGDGRIDALDTNGDGLIDTMLESTGTVQDRKEELQKIKSRVIHVGGLRGGKHENEKELTQMFSKFGTVVACTLQRRRETADAGRDKSSWALLTFETAAEVRSE